MSMPRQDMLTDPFSIYDGPQAVLDDDRLATSAKLQVLSSMEMDLAARQTADAENMAGDDDVATQFSDVRDAILKLDPSDEAHGEVDREHRADIRDHAPELTTEQARQAEVALRTGPQRAVFLTVVGVGLLAFALVAFWVAG